MNNCHNKNALFKLARTVLLLTLALLLSGCASSESPEAPPSTGSNSSSTTNQSQSTDAVSTGKTINLMDYVSVSISGENGDGKASYSFDYGTFEDVLADRLSADKDSAQFFTDATIVEESISISLDKLTGLSNGDSVVLTVSNDTEIARKYGLSFQGGTSSYSVTDLREIAELILTDQDIIALLLETTVNYNMQEISVSQDNMLDFAVVDSQIGVRPDTARLDYSFGLDCKIAILQVTGFIEYKYENDTWVDTRVASNANRGAYTLSGVYTGTEWDIAAAGVPCNARYDITELSEGVYEATVTWSAGDESPEMVEITAVIPLAVDFTTERFIIQGNNAALTAAVGRSPYLARALKFDFINGGFTTNRGFTTDIELALLKVSG